MEVFAGQVTIYLRTAAYGVYLLGVTGKFNRLTGVVPEYHTTL